MFFVFPGQGSQFPGMGSFLYENFRAAKDVFQEASDVLSLDLKRLCFTGSESDLALTENTQPALLTVSTATQRVLKIDFGITPKFAAGHSIGEYAALVSADVIKFSDAILAVRTRGRAMQSAVPNGEGGMAAVIGLEPAQVEELCNYVEKKSGITPLAPANFNCPGQIVISGSKKALDWLKENSNPEKIWPQNPPKRLKIIPLQVSAPFHCSLMMPAEEKMREVLSDIKFSAPAFAVIQNFTAEVEPNPEKIRENLIRQVSAPVRWMQSMDYAKKIGQNSVIECGHGKVLSGLFKKIDPEFFKVYSTSSLEEVQIIEKEIKR